jgi:hypothetical protein
MIDRLPGNSFVFVEFEEGGGVFEVVALALGAVRLDVAEFVEAFLELAGEALALDAEVGEEAMGVDDVKLHWLVKLDGFAGGGIGGAREHVGFEERDAVETPRSVDELLDELGFGWSGGLVFAEKPAAMVFIGSPVFGGEDGGGGGQAVAQSVERRTLLTRFGARTGGASGVGSVNGGAIRGGAMDGRDWCS